MPSACLGTATCPDTMWPPARRRQQPAPIPPISTVRIGTDRRKASSLVHLGRPDLGEGSLVPAVRRNRKAPASSSLAASPCVLPADSTLAPSGSIERIRAGSHERMVTMARSKEFVFAALPFDPSFEDVYYVAMSPAAAALGLACVRVDQTYHGGDAVAEAYRQIRACRAVVADVTHAQPDVLYELGFAHALGKPTLQICATGHQDLPFSVRNRDTLLYEQGRTHLLRAHLESYLAVLLMDMPPED